MVVYVREEAEAKEIYAENEQHLKNFGKHLESKGLSEKTIKNHLENVSFYINDFLCCYDIQDVKSGCFQIDKFLGGWFIRKAMWANCTQIKGMAASIKKFYAFMLEQKVVEKDDYDELCEDIKENMDEWLENMREFDAIADNF